MSGKTAYGDDAKSDQRESCDERDRRMDERYTFDRAALNGEGQSVLAIVGGNAEELAKEFLVWWSASPSPRDPLDVALLRWEVARFGDRLFNSAHGILSFQVKQRIQWKNPDQPRPRLTPGLTPEQRKDRMLTALDAVVEAKAMPVSPGKVVVGEYAGPRLEDEGEGLKFEDYA